MALTSPKADLELLFGVLGGGSVSGQSGTLIRGQLNELVGELNNAKNTNERKIRLSVDTQATTKEFRSKLVTTINDVNSTNKFKIKISEINADDAIKKLRDDINNALKMLRVDTGFDVKVNADGSKTAVKQIAQDAEEAIRKTERLNATLAEIASSKNSVDKSYKAAKDILGGENASGDNLGQYTAMRDKYIELNALFGEIKEKQKHGFAVSDDDISKLRGLTGETQKLTAAVIDRANAEKKAKVEAEAASKAAAKAAEQAAAAKAKADADRLENEKKLAAVEEYENSNRLERLEKLKIAQEEILAGKKIELASNIQKNRADGDSDIELVRALRIEYDNLAASINELDEMRQSGNIGHQNLIDAEASLETINTYLDNLTGRLSPEVDVDAYNAALAKTNKLLADIRKGEENWTKAKNGSSSDDYGKLSGYADELEKLKRDLDDGRLSAERFADRFNGINSKFKASASAIKAAGENMKTLGEKFKDLAEKFSKWLTVSQVVMFVARQVKKMITTVIELDDAMTELKKVTDETDGAYDKFFKNASGRAKELGVTLKDTINATAAFARLGNNIADASALADAAVVYNNVGDEIESIDDASASIISTMQAFGVEAKNVMTIVDKFNEVGNNFAISSGGIGEALLRSASALHAAGNTLDESIALITAANTIVQDPDSVGTVMKTISMYLRAAKTEAEEAGESTDGMANSVSELREELIKLTGGRVDIMLDENTYKSTYQIIKELSAVWGDLNDITKANVLEMVAGKRNANVMSAMLESFEIAEKVVETSANSAGSALAENEKVLESITGHINKFKASFEELSASIIDSDILKFLIDVGTGLVNIANSLFEIINAIGGLKTVVAGGGAYGVASVLPKLVTALGSMGSIQTAGSISTLKRLLIALGGAGLSASASIAGVATAIAAVVAAVKAYQHFNPSYDTLKEEADGAQEKLSTLQGELEATQNRIKELQKLADSGAISIVEEDELTNLKRENELLEAQLALQKELTKAKNSELIAKAKDEVGGTLYGVGSESNQVYSGAMSVDRLIERYTGLQSTASMYDTIGKSNLAEKVRTESIEYLEELQDRQDELIEKRATLAFDAGNNKELIEEVDLAIDRITVAIGDAQTLSTIWDKLWSDDSPVNGAAEMAKKLTEAANAQKELNDELKKYGSTVDLTNRPILQREDFVGKEVLDYDDSTKMVTINTQTFGASDWVEDGKPSGTSAILVTPILPDGTVFDSQAKLEEYVRSLIDPNTGEFNSALDTEGIVLAVVNEGDVEKSIDKLDNAATGLAASAHAVNEEFADLYLSDTVQDVLAYLGELGYDVEDLSAGALADMFEQVSAIGGAAADMDAMFKNLYNTVSTLSDKKNLLSELQTDIADGSISENALKSLHEQYDSLDDIIVQYRLGIATAQDVYSEYKKLYEKDEKELLSSTRWKIGLTEEYFNENIKGNAEMVKILGTYYTADFENYKELSKKKQEVDSALIKSLGENWADYYSTYASAIKTMAAKTYMPKSVFDRRGLAQEYGTYDNYVNAMTGGMLDTAFTLDDLAAKLRDIDISIKTPEGSSSSSKVDEYIADIDEYREAIERLNQAKIDVDTLDSKLEMADDVRETISLRSQLLGLYENEIDAQETLNRLRREGIAAGADKLRGMGFDVSYDAGRNSFLVNNLEHINELEAKTKGTHKSLQEATNELRKETEEYIEKLESLNEDNQEGEENWRSLAVRIREAKTDIVDDLKSIATASSEALDSIQSVYDTLRDAAADYESNSGYLSIDTYQSLLDLGPQYMQYLRDENGALVITREKIEDVIAAKVEQLALDNAMTYVERLRLAMQKDSIEDLNELLYATTEATNATWGLVYANLALLDLDDKQRDAALHNIDAMRSLADNVREGLKFTYSKDSMDELINYTMDMLRDKIDQQIEALEEMKETYGELIDLKKESLDAAKEEADHQKDTAKQLKEIAKLQARIDILSLDTSREAQAERKKLAEELSALQDGLADSQRDYAIDQQKEALDKMQEDYEAQKDNEIQALEETVSSEEKVYRMAIKHISANWDTLYNELIDWNEEMGSVINREITQAWEEAALMVERYGGNVREALNAVSSGGSSSGGMTVSSSGKYDHNSSVADAVNARVTHMKENSERWHSASKSEQDKLYNENIGYAKEIGALLGEAIVIDKSGEWRIGSTAGPKLYDKYAGIYHTGGIVGDKNGLKSNEVIATLEKGEFVVPEEHLDSFLKTVNFLSDFGKRIDTTGVRDMSLQNNADLIRSMTSVASNRTGDIHFGDVYIYGANSDTVAKHREINREFTNEVLKQLNIKR